MKLRLTISRAILIFGLVTALGLGAVIATSVYGLAQLKVGGQLYAKIKLGNDLVADILPPPEYVIEGYLEATLADAGSVAACGPPRQRMAELKKEYDERRDILAQVRPRPALKEETDGAIRYEVRRFWTAIRKVCCRRSPKPIAPRRRKGLCRTHFRPSMQHAPRHHRRHRQTQTNDDNAATEVAADRDASARSR